MLYLGLWWLLALNILNPWLLLPLLPRPPISYVLLGSLKAG